VTINALLAVDYIRNGGGRFETVNALVRPNSRNNIWGMRKLGRVSAGRRTIGGEIT